MINWKMVIFMIRTVLISSGIISNRSKKQSVMVWMSEAIMHGDRLTSFPVPLLKCQNAMDSFMWIMMIMERAVGKE